GQPQWAGDLQGILAYLAAAEGDQERCLQLVDAAAAVPAGSFTSVAAPWVQWALGLLDLGRGHPGTALVHLETISQGPAHYHATALRSIPDLVEAAVRLGQPERAAQPLARFSGWAQRAGVPGIEALAERCHALLAAGGGGSRAALPRRAEAARRAVRAGSHPAPVRCVAAPGTPQDRRQYAAARRPGQPGRDRRRAVGRTGPGRTHRHRRHGTTHGP